MVAPGTAAVPGRVPGPGIANTPGPVQGRPVSEFLPNGEPSIVRLGAGETGTGGGWATVFPLSLGLVVFPFSLGLVVFPFSIGLAVFCASAIVMVAVRPRTLRPISAIRCTGMSDLPRRRPDTDQILAIFLDFRKVKG